MPDSPIGMPAELMMSAMLKPWAARWRRLASSCIDLHSVLQLW